MFFHFPCSPTSLLSSSLYSPVKKTNCPAVFRACWAITTKWKNLSEQTHFQNSAKRQILRLPLRTSQDQAFLVQNSAVWLLAAVARASGPQLGLQGLGHHPNPKNVQDSRAGTAARGGVMGVVAAVAVAKDTEQKYEKRSRTNIAVAQNIQSPTHRVQRKALWAPPAATVTRGAPCRRSSITARIAIGPNRHKTERPTGTRLQGFTPSPVGSTRVRLSPRRSCPPRAPWRRSQQHTWGPWTAKRRQRPRVHKLKVTADNRTAALWERWSPMGRHRFPNWRFPHSQWR